MSTNYAEAIQAHNPEAKFIPGMDDAIVGSTLHDPIEPVYCADILLRKCFDLSLSPNEAHMYVRHISRSHVVIRTYLDEVDDHG